jgi:hypothetical protein
VTFNAACTSRGAVALTTWPKAGLVISPFTAVGPKNCAWLKTLNAGRHAAIWAWIIRSAGRTGLTQRLQAEKRRIAAIRRV